MGHNDLVDMFKIVSAYRGMLENLEKRYSLVEVIKYIIENDSLVGLDNEKLFIEVEKYLATCGYNILSKTVNEEAIHLFVQTNEGLEELIIDDELFASPYFAEATYLYKKILDRDTSIFEDRDMIEYLRRDRREC